MVTQPAKVILEVAARHGGHLVDHQKAWPVQAVMLGRFDEYAYQGSFDSVGRYWANGNRGGSIETIILDDHDGSRLPGVRASGRSSVNVASLHPGGVTSSVAQSHEMASTNAWSSASPSLAATAADWRCASATNSGARTSGTQIWTGRRPWRRNRSRCWRTRSGVEAMALCYM